MLTPVLALIVWTLIIWIWMYATRIPAVRREKIDVNQNIHPGSLETLPSNVRVVADNYNHLHEQPVIFYALAFYTQLAGITDGASVALAWTYVGLRVAHSFAQTILKHVMTRFVLFALASIVLVILAVRALLSL